MAMGVMTPLPLSPTERRVLDLLLRRGLSNAEIAATLGVSPNTVKTHLRNVRISLDGAGCGWHWWCRVAYALGRAEAADESDEPHRCPRVIA